MYIYEKQAWLHLKEQTFAFPKTCTPSPGSFLARFAFPNMVLREGSIHHLPVARPNDAIVCLPNGTWAPSVIGTPMTETLQSWERRLENLTWRTLHDAGLFFFSAYCEVTAAPRPLALGQLGDIGPNLPGMAGTEREDICWVCASAARQLEMGSAASLKGALHGSCVDCTAMAQRLVWQQLTLDLSSLLPNSATEKHTGPHTHKQTTTHTHTLEWHSLISYTYLFYTLKGAFFTGVSTCSVHK